MDPIFVTDGTGTLGRLVVRRLREAGREGLDGRVIALDDAGYDEARASSTAAWIVGRQSSSG